MDAIAFTLWGSPVSWVELVASGLGIVMVVANARVNPLGWPLAITSSALYAWVFFGSRLYGEAALQLVFIAAAAWGWWQWQRGTTADGEALRVRALPPALRWRVAALTAVAWPLLGLLLDHATDSDVPYLDALPTVASLAGLWLLGRQYTENWIVWAVVNAFSIVLFAHKSLWLTTGLYAVFLAMALWGWRVWHQRAQAAARPPVTPSVAT